MQLTLNSASLALPVDYDELLIHCARSGQSNLPYYGNATYTAIGLDLAVAFDDRPNEVVPLVNGTRLIIALPLKDGQSVINNIKTVSFNGGADKALFNTNLAPFPSLLANSRIIIEYNEAANTGQGAWVASSPTDAEREQLYILDLVFAAYSYVEGKVGCDLLQKTWRYNIDFFPSYPTQWVKLYNTPFLSVSSITYIDPKGDLQTYDPAEWQVEEESLHAWITPVKGSCFPTTKCQINAINILYSTGYGAQFIPFGIRQAIMRIVACALESRGDCAGCAANDPLTMNMLAPFVVPLVI